MKHQYRVELTRRVAASFYGPNAHTVEIKQKSFGFGKGNEFKTGKAARLAAIEYAKTMLDQANKVMVWRIVGSKGAGEYLKDEEGYFFGCGFDGYKKEL